MADIWQAQQEFWQSFGLPAYDDQTAFTDGDMPAYPHITYASFNGHLGQSTTLTASLWYRSGSWAVIKQKADEIQAYIGSGKTIKADNGYLWIQLPDSTPFSQPLESGNNDIKRLVLTIEAEALTGY